MASKSLSFLLFGEDVTAGKAFKKLAADAEASGGAIKGAFSGKNLLAVGALAAGLGLAVKAAANYQTQMTRLVTAAGESQKSLAADEKGVLAISAATGTSTDQLAKGLYVINSAGIHGAAGLDVLKASAQGAKIEGADLGEVTNAVTSLLVDYHRPASDAAKVTSELVAAVGHGKTTFQELATALPNVAAAAAQLNVTLPETAAAIATMTMHGTDAAKAGTYLRQVIGQLGGGGSAVARQVMQGLGIDANKLALTLSSGSGHGLADAIQMLEDGISKHLTPAGLVSIETFKKSAGSASDYQKMLADLPPAMTTTFGALSKMTGGVKSMQGFLQLGGANLATFKANTLAVADASTDAAGNVEGWAIKQQTLNQKLDELKQSGHAVGIEIGTALIPKLTTAADFTLRHKDAVIGLVGGLLGLKIALVGYKLAQETVLAIQGTATAVTRLYGKITGTTAVEVETAATTQAAAVSAGSTVEVAAMNRSTATNRQRAMIARATAASVAASSETEAAAVVASNDAIATSAKGLRVGALGAAGGIAAIGVAGYMAGMKLSSMIENGKSGVKVLDGLSHTTKDFTTALVNNGGKLDDQVKGLVQAQIESSGLADKAARAGITTDQLTGAVTGNAQAMVGLIDKWKASGKPADDTIAALELLYGSYHKAADAGSAAGEGGSKAAAGTNEATDAALANADASKKQALYDKELAAELAAEAKAALSLKTGLDTLNSKTLDVKGSQLAFLDSVQSVTDGIKQNGLSLSDNTAAGRSNQEAIIASIKAAQAHATALETSGKSAADAGRAYLTDEAALRKSATAAGFSKTEVDKLIKSYGGLPKNIRTEIQVEDAAAKAKAAEMHRILVGLPKSIQTEVKLHGLETAEYELQLLARNRVAHVEVTVGGAGASGLRSVGGVQANADGGTVTGPGGPREDKVLMWASPGEEVINAAAAGKHRKLLKAINAGMFASGGTVGGLTASQQQSLVGSQQGTAWTISQDLPKMLAAVLGSPAVLASALSKLINDVHTAVTKKIAPDSLLKTLENENGQFLKLAAQRKYAASEVAAGTARLNSLRASYAQELASVSSGVTSGFDLTSLGAGPGGPTTMGQLLALEQGRVNQAGAFAGNLGTLKGKGLMSGLISQLGNAGVGSAGDVTGILAGASAGDIKQLNALYAKDQSFGNLAGRQVAGADYGAGIAAASRFVDSWSKMSKTLDAESRAMGAHIAHQVAVNVHVTAGIGANGTQIGRDIAKELEKYAGNGGKITISKAIR